MSKAKTPPTIDQLTATLNEIEENTVNAALSEKQKMETEVTLCGKSVRVTATPQENDSRKPYRLYYVDGKRKSKKAVIPLILAI